MKLYTALQMISTEKFCTEGNPFTKTNGIYFLFYIVWLSLDDDLVGSKT